MGSKYEDLRCTGCGGTLKYDNKEKEYVCIYCGNVIHRKEEYDGLYTIKNVVKQVFVDLAYGRLDAAQKNVIECEKIASSYVGTIIAQLCMKMAQLLTPGYCQDSELKSVYNQVKRLKEKLYEMDSNISADEQALYESFEENADAFGVLLLTFDSLKAEVHLDFVNNFFDASKVYSRELNAKLLKYALKNNRSEMVDKIFANSDNIDCRSALMILLHVYADSEKKRQYMQEIFAKTALQDDDYKQFEKYLCETTDQVETKVELYLNAVRFRKAPSVRFVMEHILMDERISQELVEKVIEAFCSTKPRDAELYELLEAVYTKHTGVVANCEMKVLIDSKLFIKPSAKMVGKMLSRTDWTAQERLSMLEMSEKCKIDVKANDAIIAEVLLKNQEDVETRIVFIKKMTEYVENISTMVLTDYILKNNCDGERKPEVLDILFKLNLNMSFFKDVLSKYMVSSVDSAVVKKEITQMLSSKGLHVDSEVLVNMACNAGEQDFMDVVGFIQTSVNNGARIDFNALSTYLEKVKPENYHKELISALHIPTSRISDKALANYVLYASDEFEIKLQNSVVFAEQNGKSFGSSICTVSCFNTAVQCNLLQAYVLITDDSAAVVESMVTAMKNAGAKLNPNVTALGQSVKFKKFVTDYKAQLSPITLMLCEENKVFSFFF